MALQLNLIFLGSNYAAFLFLFNYQMVVSRFVIKVELHLKNQKSLFCRPTRDFLLVLSCFHSAHVLSTVKINVLVSLLNNTVISTNHISVLDFCYLLFCFPYFFLLTKIYSLVTVTFHHEIFIKTRSVLNTALWL